MEPETMDGMLYYFTLAANPGVTTRRQAYEARLRADRTYLRTLAPDVLRRAIRLRRLWTVRGWEHTRTVDDMVEAIVRCMQGQDRDAWLVALTPPENTWMCPDADTAWEMTMGWS